MLPPSYSDHDPLPPPSFDPLAMLFSHSPIVTQFAKLITTGDLIQLSRTSSTIREVLLQSPSYWAKLVALTSLVCSENAHIKGDNVKSCIICSMPVCETCIVKSDFHGTSGTFSNRIRTFCDSCWFATDFSHPSTSPVSTAPPVCVCVAKDGWLCSRCRSTERAELGDNKYICATDGCSSPHGASEKQRVCTWCRFPLPPAWRPVTELPIVSGAGGEEEEAPGYEEGSRKITEILNSPVDKVRVAGWDKMDEQERADYQDAWLRKGARETERAGKVVRAGESSLAGGARGAGEEVPSFEYAGRDELGESSGGAAQTPLDDAVQKPGENAEGNGEGEGEGEGEEEGGGHS